MPSPNGSQPRPQISRLTKAQLKFSHFLAIQFYVKTRQNYGMQNRGRTKRCDRQLKLQKEMIYDLVEDLHHTMDTYIASTISHARPNGASSFWLTLTVLFAGRCVKSVKNISKDLQYVKLFNHLILRCCQRNQFSLTSCVSLRHLSKSIPTFSLWAPKRDRSVSSCGARMFLV